jgi:hypothetical protein
MIDSLKAHAHEYLKNVPNDWLTVTIRCKAFYCAKALLEDSPEIKALGHTIAFILKNKYDFDTATYHAASNSITVKSKNY